jgi:hypothetical protein
MILWCYNRMYTNWYDWTSSSKLVPSNVSIISAFMNVMLGKGNLLLQIVALKYFPSLTSGLHLPANANAHQRDKLMSQLQSCCRCYFCISRWSDPAPWYSCYGGACSIDLTRGSNGAQATFRPSYTREACLCSCHRGINSG